MASASFLEKIYLDSLDLEAFRACGTVRNFDRVKQLTERCRELLAAYPAHRIESEGRVPQEMLDRMGEIGLFGMSIPEAYGGLGFNLWEYLRVVEELVRLDIAVALVAIAHLSIGVKGVILFGTEAQKQQYLTRAASGEMIFSYALTEPRIGSDAQRIETRAELSADGTHYLLNGQKTYITNANYAGGLTVFAQMDPARPGFMGAFIVETGWEGVHIGKDMPKMGLKVSSTAAIQLRNVRVPAENLIGAPGEGFRVAMTVLNYGRLGLGASSVGMMRQSLEDMVKRSASRIQFQVPIKEFSLIQEKMVKARVYSFINAAMNDFAASLLEREPLANAAIESSHCKLFGTTRAWDTVYDALQVAGGAGYIATNPYEKRMRDFRVSTVFEGTTEIHSIYPPLYLARRITKELKRLELSRSAEALELLKGAFQKLDWPITPENPVLRKASRLARSLTRAIRRLLYLGLLIYGNALPKKEFYLRRVTTLSVYAFGLVAAVARLMADQRAGVMNAEELTLLQYFIEEAREAKSQNNRLLDSNREALNERIVRDLFQP